jgi:hypothetical protein
VEPEDQCNESTTGIAPKFMADENKTNEHLQKKWLVCNGTVASHMSYSASVDGALTNIHKKSNSKTDHMNLLTNNRPLSDKATSCNNIHGQLTKSRSFDPGSKSAATQEHRLIQRRAGRPQNFYAQQRKGRNIYNTRKQLMQERTKACDFSVIFAVIGLALTVIEAETTAVGFIEKVSF